MVDSFQPTREARLILTHLSRGDGETRSGREAFVAQFSTPCNEGSPEAMKNNNLKMILPAG